MPPQQPLTLLWNGRPVGVITDWGAIDWLWFGGTFAPADFPKDLADYLLWRRRQNKADQYCPSAAGFLDGHWANWSIHFPDGTAQEVWVSEIEETGGVIVWS